MIDITREEKQAIAVAVQQSGHWIEQLQDARARLARLDEQIGVLAAHLVDVRAQLAAAAYGERGALREEIGDLEKEIRSLRAERPKLEQSVADLDHRYQQEIGAGISAARRKLEQAREGFR